MNNRYHHKDSKNRNINRILAVVTIMVLCITAIILLRLRNNESREDMAENTISSNNHEMISTENHESISSEEPGITSENIIRTEPEKTTKPEDSLSDINRGNAQIAETSGTTGETQTESAAAGSEEFVDASLSGEQKDSYITNTPDEQPDSENEEAPEITEHVTNRYDKPLSGMVICIDPGHHGYGQDDGGVEAIAPGSSEMKEKDTSGTAGRYTGVAEYILNLEVGLILRDKLEKMGAVVVMTRTTHETSISNIERAAIANENNSDMLIRIHADGSNDSSVRGYSILIPGNRYTPDIVEDSLRMAEILDSVLKEYITIPSRGIVTRHDLTGFNWLEKPGILLEMGFMTNRTDDETMQTPEFQDNVTDAIAEALIQYRTNG